MNAHTNPPQMGELPAQWRSSKTKHQNETRFRSEPATKNEIAGFKMLELASHRVTRTKAHTKRKVRYRFGWPTPALSQTSYPRDEGGAERQTVSAAAQA